MVLVQISGIGHLAGQFIPVTQVLQFFHLFKIHRIQDTLGRVESPKLLFYGFVDDPVIFQRGFPTHPANHSHGFHDALRYNLICKPKISKYFGLGE